MNVRMKRIAMTQARRIRIFDAAGGVCHLCGVLIGAPKEQWDVDHVKPLWLGGIDDESNMRPAHKRCHVNKSATESESRAKGTRVRAKHIGIRAKSTFRRAPAREKPTSRYDALRAMREQHHARGGKR